jgi:hypothetical protein
MGGRVDGTGGVIGHPVVLQDVQVTIEPKHNPTPAAAHQFEDTKDTPKARDEIQSYHG